MANRQRGAFTIKAGKRRLTLRLTTNAVCELEDFAGANGRTWEQVLKGIDQSRLKDVRLFFWVALRDAHPDIASDDPACLKSIGDLIDDMGGMMGIVKQVATLVALNAMPEDEAAEVPKTTRPQDGQAGIGDGSKPTH